LLIVLVIADGRLIDAEMVQQPPCVPRVFAGDQADFLQYAQGAQGDVFEIADGSRNQIESHKSPQSLARFLLLRDYGASLSPSLAISDPDRTPVNVNGKNCRLPQNC